MGETERDRSARIVQFDQAEYQALRRRFDQPQEAAGRRIGFFAALGRPVSDLRHPVGEAQRDIGSPRAAVSEAAAPMR